MRKFTQPAPGVGVRGSYSLAGNGLAIADSGAISAYQRSVTTKRPALLARYSRQVDQLRGKHIVARKTSQQGTAAASPSTYQQTLWPQRFEKAQYIADNYDQWYNDPACRKSCNMYVYEAIRGGVKIRVIGEDDISKRAQDIADEYVQLWPVHGGPDDGISLMGGGLCAMIAGEFWPQAAVTGEVGNGKIQRFLNLPAVGMERNTDDADQFIDPQNAYSQVDTQTWADVAQFPLWAVYNARWNWIPGSKNGNPEIISVRRLARLLELMEACKVTQVQVRSSLRYVYSYGTPENPASPDEVRDLMALNGFVEGKREIFDPSEIARDIHMGGVGGVSVLEGDQNVGVVEHLRYFLDRYANGLPTPRQLMALGSENINRDTLKDLRAQWMADTVRINQFLDGPVKYFFELALMLQCIDPDDILYETMWSKSTIASEEEQILAHINMVAAGLESKQQAVTNLQQYTRIPSIAMEMEFLAKEADEAAEREMNIRSSFQTVSDKMKDEDKALKKQSPKT